MTNFGDQLKSSAIKKKLKINLLNIGLSLSIYLIFVSIYPLFAQSALPFHAQLNDQSLSISQKWIDSLGWTEIESESLVWQESDQTWQFKQVQLKWKSLEIKCDQMQVQIKEDTSISLKAFGHLNLKHAQGTLEAGLLTYHQKNEAQIILLSNGIKGNWLDTQIQAKQASLQIDPILLEVQQIQLKFNLPDLVRQLQQRSKM
jgi:hypothetical protein